MQTCSRCQTQSSDSALTCPSCQANLQEMSLTAVALKRFQSNPRVTSVRLSTAGDACPACLEAQGTYAKDEAPLLPHAGCSSNHGCRCFYEPILNSIFP